MGIPDLGNRFGEHDFVRVFVEEAEERGEGGHVGRAARDAAVGAALLHAAQVGEAHGAGE